MGREFWMVRRPGWVAGGLVVAVVALTAWLLRAKSGANTATVLALSVSIIALAVTVRGLWPTPPLSRVARELADRVARERGQARQQALAMSGDARPAEMGFRSPQAQDEPELVRWRSDGGPEHGTLTEVAGFYRSLDRGRLVVLGGPGAGKTVLATQLVLDLVAGLPAGELQPGGRPPVPVWLSLTSADLGAAEELARASAEDLAARLDRWIAAGMCAEYQIQRSAADRLIRGGWVLPVLDALDEMDAPVAGADGGRAARPRAAAVVRALNAGTGRRPVVLVCRRGDYGQLASSASAGAEDPVLQDASQIVLQPLDVAAICDYLARRFPGDSPGTMASRWRGVQVSLEDPAAPGRAAGLAVVLSSPWRLFLASAAYKDDASDPDELTRLSADEADEHLLGQLIPAVAGRTSLPGGGHYQPGDVRAWLGTLARHLDQTSSDPGLRWSPTDLRLERLWPIAGPRTVRWLSMAASIALVAVPLAVFGLLWVHANGRWYPGAPAAWFGLVGSIVGIVMFGVLLVADTSPTLYRLDLRLTSARLAGGLAAGLSLVAAGLIGGLALGLAVGLATGLATGLAVGLAVGLAFGLTEGLAGSFHLAARPTTVMHQNIRFGLATGLVAGLALGLEGWLAGGRALGLALGLASGLVTGLATGLAIWLRYLIGCWLARRQGILPPRVGQFLDWAHRANLVRMAGTAAQFRHRDLQAWLTQQPSIDPRRTTLGEVDDQPAGSATRSGS